MIRFVDREEEMDALEREWNKNRASFVVIYGRRRVGKTELVLRFLEKHAGIYYLADRKTYKENIKSFQKVVAEFLSDDIVARAEFENWMEVFAYLMKRLRKRVVIVIDEFPYLLERGVLEEFQKIWDTILSKREHMLILIGSSVSMMERNVLSYGSPLYGRRSAQLKLGPLKFWNIKDFFPKYDFEDLLKVYAVLDGIPQYLLLFSPDLSFRENMLQNYLTKSSPLYEDGEILLRDELRELRRYFCILEAISKGKRSFSDIKNKVGMESNTLARYLDILKSIGVVKEDTPIFNEKTKRYRLADNYFRFWFRYVYPNRWMIESEKGEKLLEKIEKDFNQYLSEVFEDVVRDYIARKMNFDLVKKWWNRIGEEIDIVAINDSEILFGEVKWRNKKVDWDVVEEIQRKAELIKYHKKHRKENYLIVSRSGFTKRCIDRMKENDIIYWDIEHLEKMMFGSQ